MKQQLEAILSNAKNELSQTQNARELDAVRVKYLGKKGELTAILKGMKKCCTRGASCNWSTGK